MRTLAMTACLTMAGCTNGPSGRSDVDLNAAAAAAQDDIAHYAASRHRHVAPPVPRALPSATAGPM